jgi:hypothetical protein
MTAMLYDVVSNTCFASMQVGKYAAKQSMVRRRLKKRDSFLRT